MKPVFIGLLACAAASLLSACVSGPDPYVELQQRTTRAANTGNAAVADSLSSLRCPTGMTAVADNADVSNNTDVRYSERHGDSGGNNSRSNNFQTYSGADVRVQAQTNARGNRRMRCVRPISLSLPR